MFEMIGAMSECQLFPEKIMSGDNHNTLNPIPPVGAYSVYLPNVKGYVDGQAHLPSLV